MPKYRVYLVTEASASVEVEAEDESEAIDLAFERAPVACFQCPGIGDWTLLSDMYPKQYTSDDDYELIGE